MDTGTSARPTSSLRVRRWQFATCQIVIATTGIAAVLGLAKWGAWIHSDAVLYISMAVAAAVFSSTARRALLGVSAIVGSLWLAMTLGEMLFGAVGRGPDPRWIWVSAALLTSSAMLLRRFTNATRFSLMISLVLAELLVAIVIVYAYGCPTLFEAFDNQNREYVFRHLLRNFPGVIQLVFVVPWLAGIVLGDVWAGHKATVALAAPVQSCRKELDKCESDT